MGWADYAQFLLVILLMGFSTWWLLTAKERQASILNNKRDIRLINTAGSVSQLDPRLDPYIFPGSVIYMPTGDGLYLTRHKNSRNRRYKKMLSRWIQRGSIIHIIVTQPSNRAIAHWFEMKRWLGQNLHVHILDRNQATGDRAQETRTAIERLDTYHAVIVVSPVDAVGAPGVMWLEACHPLGSKHAYGIEFVGPKEAQDDPRLIQYRDFYETLLSGSHAIELGGCEDDRMTEDRRAA